MPYISDLEERGLKDTDYVVVESPDGDTARVLASKLAGDAEERKALTERVSTLEQSINALEARLSTDFLEIDTASEAISVDEPHPVMTISEPGQPLSLEELTTKVGELETKLHQIESSLEETYLEPDKATE